MSSSSSSPQPASAPRSPTVDQARWFADEVRPHDAAVRGYLRSRFPTLDADDVIQESYLKLLKLHAAEKVGSAKAYFYAVARNTALTLFRRSRIYSDIPVSALSDSLILDESCNTEESTYSRERLETVVEAIEGLPSRCREVMRLSVLEGRSSAEIAARLNIAESTVRVQMVRGVQRCTEFMRKRGERK